MTQVSSKNRDPTIKQKPNYKITIVSTTGEKRVHVGLGRGLWAVT